MGVLTHVLLVLNKRTFIHIICKTLLRRFAFRNSLHKDKMVGPDHFWSGPAIHKSFTSRELHDIEILIIRIFQCATDVKYGSWR